MTTSELTLTLIPDLTLMPDLMLTQVVRLPNTGGDSPERGDLLWIAILVALVMGAMVLIMSARVRR